MIYFIHDETSRTIKIGCARDPKKRLSTLQISTSNKLVLLGAIAGTERTEKKVHDLVCRQCAPKPGESFTRPLRVSGEWFDDRILPFVSKLMDSPKEFLGDKKPPARPVTRHALLHQGRMVLSFDSGERYQESFLLEAATPDLALTALERLADARLAFLANTVQITALAVTGRPVRKTSLRGTFTTQKVYPREGLSVIFNSVSGNAYGTSGVKQYSNHWFHGVPDELCREDGSGYGHPTDQFHSLLHQFATGTRRGGTCATC